MKGIVTLKESLIEQVDKHQEAIEALEKNITTPQISKVFNVYRENVE